MSLVYADNLVQLWQGDCRELIPALSLTGDLVLADPPYAETSLAWDRWPDGWPAIAATVAAAMWSFGSMRMLLNRRDEFAAWKLSQDVVWAKHAGTSMAADRFRRIHEHVTFWYQGRWRDVHHTTPRVIRKGKAIAGVVTHGRRSAEWQGESGPRSWTDDGTRLHTSVIHARSMHRKGAIHPTEKPVDLLTPLLSYACPPGGTVIDPFAGSASTLVAARALGLHAVGIEADPEMATKAARRLSEGSQTTLDFLVEATTP